MMTSDPLEITHCPITVTFPPQNGRQQQQQQLARTAGAAHSPHWATKLSSLSEGEVCFSHVQPCLPSLERPCLKIMR